MGVQEFDHECKEDISTCLNNVNHLRQAYRLRVISRYLSHVSLKMYFIEIQGLFWEITVGIHGTQQHRNLKQQWAEPVFLSLQE